MEGLNMLNFIRRLVALIYAILPLRGNKRLPLSYIKLFKDSRMLKFIVKRSIPEMLSFGKKFSLDNTIFDLCFANECKDCNSKEIVVCFKVKSYLVNKYKACLYNRNCYLKVFIGLNDKKLRYQLVGFDSDFDSLFYSALSNNPLNEKFFSLEGFRDILLAFNKISSFKKLNKQNFHMKMELAPKYYSCYNLKTTIQNGLGNFVDAVSYHQDNKMRTFIRQCMKYCVNDLEKINSVIAKVESQFVDPDVLCLRSVISDDGYVEIFSNSTHILKIETENDLDSFLTGAEEAFRVLGERGICRVNNNTYFREIVYEDGRMEFIPISGKKRLIATMAEVERIKLKK